MSDEEKNAPEPDGEHDEAARESRASRDERDEEASVEAERPSLLRRLVFAVLGVYLLIALFESLRALSAADGSAAWWNQLLWVGTYLWLTMVAAITVVSPRSPKTDSRVGVPLLVLLFLIICGRVLHFFVNLS